MLHRGKYAIEGPSPESARRKFSWGGLIGFDREFTRGDKIISASVFVWGMFWFAVFSVMTILYLFNPWSMSVWTTYWHLYAIVIPIFVGVVTTIWFTWGGTRDLLRLFRDLKSVKRDSLDDGSVVNHHNLNEEKLG
jgi:SSS family solute:Na+ symporter